MEPDHKMNFLLLTKQIFKISTFIGRFGLKKEKENRRSAEMLYENIQEQLTRKEEQYNKEVEMKQQVELNLRTLDMELRTLRNDFNQVNL